MSGVGAEGDGLGLTGLPDFTSAEPSRDMRPELLSRPWTVDRGPWTVVGVDRVDTAYHHLCTFHSAISCCVHSVCDRGRTV